MYVCDTIKIEGGELNMVNLEKRACVGKLALIGVLVFLLLSMLNICIYFLLYLLLFSLSNVFLCTTLNVVQLSIFASLATFIIKLIFFNKGRD